MEATKIILKSGKDQSLRRYHPWVFSGAIKKIIGQVAEGDLVNVYDNKDEFLGLGHYQPSSIAVRILSFYPIEIDQDYWNTKIDRAYQLRKKLGLIDTNNNNVYRLIHAEGDELPGLIIDVYNETAIIQMHSVGMYHSLEQIINALNKVLGNSIKTIYNKSENTLPFKADHESKNEYLKGEKPDDCVVSEYGNKFQIDWESGQKTGFFIDQRENRKLLQQYSEGKSVLNMFCYTGGFSVYAMQGNANLVHSVDSSKKAIELTDKNIELNFPGTDKHKSYAVDAFEYLEKIKDQYDVIVLDPPAFAKHHNVLHNALQGYKRLNAKAIEQIKPGGIIFTFSCSQVVSKENFRKSVFAASANTGRSVKILHQMTQPPDHAVNIYHPESEYLKGLVLQVD